MGFLQETHSTRINEKIWRSEWGGEFYFSHGQSNARGVGILIQKSLTTITHTVVRDGDGRYLILDITLNGNRMTLANCYAPNTDSPEFFEAFFKEILKIKNEDCVIAGDFNATLSAADKNTPGFTHPKCTQKINNYIQDCKLADIWRIKNLNRKMFTWKKTKPKILYERLDYILVNQDLITKIKKAKISPSFKSDHSFPEIELNFDTSPKGNGYWKLNTSHLEDIEFCQKVRDIISEINSDQYEDVFLKWELIKMKVRGMAIQYGSRKKKSDSNKIKVLNKKLEEIDKQRAQEIRIFTEPEVQINRIKNDIEEINKKSTIGAMLRNKQNWYDGGEKCTKYFLSLEKYKAARKSITHLSTDTGDVNSPEAVMKEIRQFYSQLYKTQNMSDHLLDNYLGDIVFPKITREDKDMLNLPISLEEIEIVVRQMKRQKCPGLDGLPIEFYQKFLPEIKHTLHSVYQKAVSEGKLNKSARQGVISLLPKPNKDLSLLKNWRPLTMLCCDYKIFTKILGNRIQVVLPQIISEDQKGFMKGRNITDNLLELQSIIDYYTNKNKPAFIISVDMEKAFDKSELNILYAILRKFGFGEQFIQYIGISMKDFSNSILNNGNRSTFFYPSRGLKQGDPYSPYLFICLIETIALKIRQNDKIKGVTIEGIKKMLGQFADDMWTASEYDRDSFNETIKTFQDFEKYTGLKINYDKTEILRIGSLNNTDASFYTRLPIVWSDGPITVLGIQFANSIRETCQINYERLCQKITTIIKQWNNRELTLLGKVQICNNLILSQFWYAATVLCKLPAETLTKIKKLIRKFIWNNKQARIAYDKLIQNLDNGGLNLQDLESKIQALKCKVIYNRDNLSPFLKACLEYFTEIKIDDWQQVNISPPASKTQVVSIWNDIAQMWHTFNHYQPTSKEAVLNQSLWHNSHIAVDKKNYSKGIIKKIKYVRDLLNPYHEWFTLEEIKTKYHVCLNFLNYGTLINKIPKEWHLIIKNKIQIEPQSAENKIKAELKETRIKNKPTNASVSKTIYQILIKNKKVDNSRNKIKWEADLDYEIKDQIWEKMFIMTKTLTNCTKLQFLQYRINHRALVTNSLRHKWDSNVSELCTFCQKTEETIMHIFVKCEKVMVLWKLLGKWLKHFCFIDLHINGYDIMFNRYRDSFPRLVNTIILIVKQYIYASKCLNKELKFTEIISKIQEYKVLEKVNAVKNNRLEEHIKKWSIYDV